MKSYQGVMCSVVPLLFACSGAASDDCSVNGQGQSSCTQQITQEGRSWQGRSWQGRSWQGRSWQGTDPVVSTVQQVSIGGSVVGNLQLNGTVLVGSLNGQNLSGADFIGATVTQLDFDGTTFDSTITDVQVDSQDPSGEILLYTITAYDPDTGTVQNICNPDPWGGQYATPVYGSWDYSGEHINSTTEFMFGCTSGVVAKCVRWGYKPWKTVNGQPLADYHQTCTRMARADYCGDGVSHTEDGTLIDMYDDLGIEVRTPFSLTSPLFFDAAWTSNGAYCITKTRWITLLTLPTVTCQNKFLSLFPLLEASPVDSTDLCAVHRTDVSRSQVRMDNCSGLNIELE